MGPKKPTKAVAAKAKQRVEDKTFGMKNKKGSKNQKFIANEQKQAGIDKGAMARAEARKQEERRSKIEEEKRLKRQQELLKAKILKAKEAAAEKSGNPVKREVPVQEEEAQVVSGPSLTLTCGPSQPTAEQLAKLARKNAPKKEKVVEVIISLEELVEKERAALHKKGNLTPVTLESFTAWKTKVQKAKAAADKKKMIDKKLLNKKTGKEFFTQNPNVAVQDAEDVEEEEVDARIEVREKRITEDDKDTLVFGEDALLTQVTKLSVDTRKDVDKARADPVVTPAGGDA